MRNLTFAFALVASVCAVFDAAAQQRKARILTGEVITANARTKELVVGYEEYSFPQRLKLTAADGKLLDGIEPGMRVNVMYTGFVATRVREVSTPGSGSQSSILRRRMSSNTGFSTLLVKLAGAPSAGALALPWLEFANSRLDAVLQTHQRILLTPDVDKSADVDGTTNSSGGRRRRAFRGVAASTIASTREASPSRSTSGLKVPAGLFVFALAPNPEALRLLPNPHLLAGALTTAGPAAAQSLDAVVARIRAELPEDQRPPQVASAPSKTKEAPAKPKKESSEKPKKEADAPKEVEPRRSRGRTN